MNKTSANDVLVLFTIIAFISLFGFSIFSDGMFFDGVVYAAVSNNYAHHVGSFWHLQYTSTLDTSFSEQPPLALFLQMLFFRLLGDSIYTERIYCFLFALLNIYLIRNIWNQLVEKSAGYFWLPVFLWTIIPVTSWTFQNNLLEVTMSAFDLLAVSFIIKGCTQKKWHPLLIGALFTCCAGLSKGLQGLFPLMVPMLFWIVYRKDGFIKSMLRCLIVLIIPIIIIFLLYHDPSARESLQRYLNNRLSGTFSHLRDSTNARLFLLYKLGLQLLIPSILITICRLMTRKKNQLVAADKKAMLFILCIGFSGSLPLLITLEQRVFYLTPSIPYFALALGLLAFPIARYIMNRLPGRNFRLTKNILNGIILILIILVPLTASRSKRDADLIEDLSILDKTIPAFTAVSIPSEFSFNWIYHAYFMRYCQVSLDDKNNHQYFLSAIDLNVPLDACYKDLKLPLKKFRLYECKNN